MDKHKVTVEKVLSEFTLQNGFVGSKQYIHDWTLRKKEVTTELNKVLTEKIKQTNN